MAIEDVVINASAQEIETMAKRQISQEITENSSVEELASAKAVYNAVKNAGGGGGGGGIAPLIVTMNAETGKATHDSEQIAQHLRDGGTAIARNIQTSGDYLRIQDFYYSRCYTSEQHDGSVRFYVSFVNTDGPILTELQIDDTSEITVNVIDQIGDISSALDDLHTYAQGLINGGAAE